MSSWFFARLKDCIASFFKPKQKKPSTQDLRDDKVYNAYRAKMRKEIDRLLDKISRHGVNSLTNKERMFLDENKDI